MWSWRTPTPRHPWGWCRIYHRSAHTPDGLTHRTFGPLHRLDPHIPDAAGNPQQCPEGRSVLYVAGNLTTAIGEVFGDTRVAAVCPGFRVSLVRPVAPIAVLDLHGQNTAMRIGALPSLATGDYPRARTQAWARAIYDDQPVAEGAVSGVYYHAAHSNGRALALWDTESQLSVIRDSRGDEQDFALAATQLWPRVVAAAVALGMRAEVVATCPSCPT